MIFFFWLKNVPDLELWVLKLFGSLQNWAFYEGCRQALYLDSLLLV